MKHIFLFILFGLGLLFPPAARALEQHTYKVTTGDNQGFETQTWDRTRSGYLFTTPQSRNSYDNYRNQLVWEFRQESDGDSFKAMRLGNKIRLVGTFHHNRVQKEYTVDSRPWFQYPEYSLRDFVISTEKRREFWIISPDDLSIFEFEACKIGTESVAIAGHTIKTVCVRIKPTGFYGNFWHADYWFSLQDGAYIRYQAVHGGPGTPPTIKLLVP
jgi:hypothetical protein